MSVDDLVDLMARGVVKMDQEKEFEYPECKCDECMEDEIDRLTEENESLKEKEKRLTEELTAARNKLNTKDLQENECEVSLYKLGIYENRPSVWTSPGSGGYYKNPVEAAEAFNNRTRELLSVCREVADFLEIDKAGISLKQVQDKLKERVIEENRLKQSCEDLEKELSNACSLEKLLKTVRGPIQDTIMQIDDLVYPEDFENATWVKFKDIVVGQLRRLHNINQTLLKENSTLKTKNTDKYLEYLKNSRDAGLVSESFAKEAATAILASQVGNAFPGAHEAINEYPIEESKPKKDFRRFIWPSVASLATASAAIQQFFL